jgi:hypothetical protein
MFYRGDDTVGPNKLLALDTVDTGCLLTVRSR